MSKIPSVARTKNIFFNVSRLVKDKGKYKTDPTTMLKPPYIVTWNGMTKHTTFGEKQCATVNMVNKWIVVPKFAHLLIAAQKNKSLIKIAKDEDVH